MLLPGLYQELIAASLVTAQLASPASGSVFINTAIKQANRPFLVMNLVSAPPAGSTLDGISALIEGEIQFDSYADTPQAARALSQAVKSFLMGSFLGGTLPDGSTIQFVDVTMDHDEAYEQGGVAYLYRCLLRLKAFYSESGGFYPTGGGSVIRYNLTPAPDGTTVVFTAAALPAAISASSIVVRNGEILTPNVDYTYAADLVTFAVAPGSGDNLAIFQ